MILTPATGGGEDTHPNTAAVWGVFGCLAYAQVVQAEIVDGCLVLRFDDGTGPVVFVAGTWTRLHLSLDAATAGEVTP